MAKVYSFCPERRTMEEALKEEKVFRSLEDLKDYVARDYDLGYSVPGGVPSFTSADVFLKKLSVDDPRTGWTNTSYALIDGIIYGRCGEKEESYAG